MMVLTFSTGCFLHGASSEPFLSSSFTISVNLSPLGFLEAPSSVSFNIIPSLLYRPPHQKKFQS